MKKENKNKVTHVPNVLFDNFLPELKLNELKVLLTIIRLTIGFASKSNPELRKAKDWITIGRFKSVTGLSRRSITGALDSLTNKKLIEVTDPSGKLLLSPWERRGQRRIFFACTFSPFLHEQNCTKTSANSVISSAQNSRITNSNSITKSKVAKKSRMWTRVGDYLNRNRVIEKQLANH